MQVNYVRTRTIRFIELGYMNCELLEEIQIVVLKIQASINKLKAPALCMLHPTSFLGFLLFFVCLIRSAEGDSVARISTCAPALQSPTKFTLNSSSLTKSHIQCLLQNRLTLQSITLKAADLNDISVSLIFSQPYPSLVDLDLSSNNITDQSLLFFERVQLFRNLQVLKIGYNPLGHRLINSLIQAQRELEKPVLRTLHIQGLSLYMNFQDFLNEALLGILYYTQDISLQGVRMFFWDVKYSIPFPNRNVKKLSLSDPVNFRKERHRDLLYRLPQLESLQLDGYSRFSRRFPGDKHILADLHTFKLRENLRKLSLHNCAVDDEAVMDIFGKEWPRLEELDISHNNVTFAGLSYIISACPRLKQLNIAQNSHLSDGQVSANFKLDCLLWLNSLQIGYNQISDEETAQLLQYLSPVGLRKLQIKYNYITSEAFRVFQKFNFSFQELEELEFEEVSLLREAYHLFNPTRHGFSALRRMSLRACSIEEETARLLAGFNFSRLEHLDLTRNAIVDEDMISILRNVIGRLRSLRIGENSLTDQFIENLAELAQSREMRLEVLDLSRSEEVQKDTLMPAKTSRKLAESGLLDRVEFLNLNRLHIGPEGLQNLFLADLSNLRVLLLDQNDLDDGSLEEFLQRAQLPRLRDLSIRNTSLSKYPNFFLQNKYYVIERNQVDPAVICQLLLSKKGQGSLNNIKRILISKNIPQNVQFLCPSKIPSSEIRNRDSIELEEDEYGEYRFSKSTSSGEGD